MSKTLNPRTTGLILGALGVLILSFDSVLIRLSDSHFLTVVFWRGLFSGCAIFLALMVIHRRNTLAYFKHIDAFQMGIACCHAIGALLFVISISYTLVAHTLIILATTPLFAAVLSFFLLKERITQSTAITLFIAMAGIAYLSLGIQTEVNLNLKNIILGDAAALLTAFLFALILTLARKRPDTSLIPSIGLSGFITALICLILLPSIPYTLNEHNWLPLAIMGLIVIPLSFSLIMSAPSYLPSPEVSLLLLIESLLGPIWVWIGVGEQPCMHSIIGGTITLSALVGLNVYQARQEKITSK